jgi:DNA-directed RNA polymerase beta' subunit
MQLRTLSKFAHYKNEEGAHPMDVLREYWALWEQLQVSYWTLFSESVLVNQSVKNSRALAERDNQRKKNMQERKLLNEHLSGKEGLPRGNMGRKRVDYTARAVITPDVVYDVFNVGIPEQMASVVTVHIRVTAFNIPQIRAAIRRGARTPGGAANILIPSSSPQNFTSELVTGSFSSPDGTLEEDKKTPYQTPVITEHLRDEEDEDSVCLQNEQEALRHSQSVGALLTQSRSQWNRYRQNLAETEQQLYRLNGMDGETREIVAKRVQVGWTVEVHLGGELTNDCHMLNRQPNLNKYNQPSVYPVVLRDSKTLQTNPNYCKPTNMDYDGDEMNMQFFQTTDARTESRIITCIVHTPLTQEQSDPTYGPIQDVISGMYLMTAPGTLFPREEFVSLFQTIWYPPKTPGDPSCVYPPARRDSVLEKIHIHEGPTTVELEQPAIIKGPGVPSEGMYTGHQLFSVLLPPDAQYASPSPPSTRLHEDDPLVEFTRNVGIQDGHMWHGQLSKKTISTVQKSILQMMAMEYGDWANSLFVSDLQRLALNYTRTYGTINTTFTACLPPPSVRPRLQRLAENIFKLYHNMSQLTSVPAHVRKARQMHLLQSALMVAGDTVANHLSPDHPLNILVQSGSKGSTVNLGQMMGFLGQQSLSLGNIEGHYLPNGDLRTLCIGPHHVASDPRALGFCDRSYYRGLTPQMYFKHMMAGVDGLADTQTATPKAGYMSRAMMQATAACCVFYDGTVRNVHNKPIMWTYLDGFDPGALHVTDWSPENLPGGHRIAYDFWDAAVRSSPTIPHTITRRESTDSSHLMSPQVEFVSPHTKELLGIASNRLEEMWNCVHYASLWPRTQLDSTPFVDPMDKSMRTPVEWRTCMYRGRYIGFHPSAEDLRQPPQWVAKLVHWGYEQIEKATVRPYAPYCNLSRPNERPQIHQHQEYTDKENGASGMDSFANAVIHSLYTLVWTDWILSYTIWLRYTQAQTGQVLDIEGAYCPCNAAQHISTDEPDLFSSSTEEGRSHNKRDQHAWTFDNLLSAIIRKAEDITAYWKSHGSLTSISSSSPSSSSSRQVSVSPHDSTRMVRAYFLQWGLSEGLKLWNDWFAPFRRQNFNEGDNASASTRGYSVADYAYARAHCLYHTTRQWVYRAMQCRVAPGEAVGSQAVHSAMRPASQSTLNVFHLAGVSQHQSVVATGLDRIDQLVGGNDCHPSTVAYITPIREVEEEDEGEQKSDVSTNNSKTTSISRSLFQLQQRLQAVSLDKLISRVDIRCSYDDADLLGFLHPFVIAELYERLDNDPAIDWKRIDGNQSTNVIFEHPPSSSLSDTENVSFSCSSSVGNVYGEPHHSDSAVIDNTGTIDNSRATEWAGSVHPVRRNVHSAATNVSVFKRTCSVNERNEEGKGEEELVSSQWTTNIEQVDDTCPLCGSKQGLSSPWLRHALRHKVSSPLQGMITPVQEWGGRPPELRKNGISMQSVLTYRMRYVYKQWKMFHYQSNEYIAAEKKNYTPPNEDDPGEKDENTGEPLPDRDIPSPASYGSRPDRIPTCVITNLASGIPTRAAADGPSGRSKKTKLSTFQKNTERAIRKLQRRPLRDHELPPTLVSSLNTSAVPAAVRSLLKAERSRHISPWYLRLQLDGTAMHRWGYTVYMIRELLQTMFCSKDILVAGGVQASRDRQPVICLFFLHPSQMVRNWLSHEMPVPQSLSPVDLDFLCVQQFQMRLLQHMKCTSPLHGQFTLVRAQTKGRQETEIRQKTESSSTTTHQNIEKSGWRYTLQSRMRDQLYGYGVRPKSFINLLETPGIDPYTTWVDNPIEIERVLGIDAAFVVLQRELQRVLVGAAPKIDPRHALVIARTMTTEGYITAMNRYQLKQMVSSIITNLSFEKTVPHLYSASQFAARDPLRGNLERIYLGLHVPQGTGAVTVHERFSSTQGDETNKRPGKDRHERSSADDTPSVGSYDSEEGRQTPVTTKGLSRETYESLSDFPSFWRRNCSQIYGEENDPEDPNSLFRIGAAEFSTLLRFASENGVPLQDLYNQDYPISSATSVAAYPKGEERPLFYSAAETPVQAPEGLVTTLEHMLQNGITQQKYESSSSKTKVGVTLGTFGLPRASSSSSSETGNDLGHARNISFFDGPRYTQDDSCVYNSLPSETVEALAEGCSMVPFTERLNDILFPPYDDDEDRILPIFADDEKDDDEQNDRQKDANNQQGTWREIWKQWVGKCTDDPKVQAHLYVSPSPSPSHAGSYQGEAEEATPSLYKIQREYHCSRLYASNACRLSAQYYPSIWVYMAEDVDMDNPLDTGSPSHLKRASSYRKRGKESATSSAISASSSSTGSTTISLSQKTRSHQYVVFAAGKSLQISVDTRDEEEEIASIDIAIANPTSFVLYYGNNDSRNAARRVLTIVEYILSSLTCDACSSVCLSSYTSIEFQKEPILL